MEETPFLAVILSAWQAVGRRGQLAHTLRLCALLPVARYPYPRGWLRGAMTRHSWPALAAVVRRSATGRGSANQLCPRASGAARTTGCSISRVPGGATMQCGSLFRPAATGVRLDVVLLLLLHPALPCCCEEVTVLLAGTGACCTLFCPATLALIGLVSDESCVLMCAHVCSLFRTTPVRANTHALLILLIGGPLPEDRDHRRVYGAVRCRRIPMLLNSRRPTPPRAVTARVLAVRSAGAGLHKRNI